MQYAVCDCISHRSWSSCWTPVRASPAKPGGCEARETLLVKRTAWLVGGDWNIWKTIGKP